MVNIRLRRTLLHLKLFLLLYGVFFIFKTFLFIAIFIFLFFQVLFHRLLYIFFYLYIIFALSLFSFGSTRCCKLVCVFVKDVSEPENRSSNSNRVLYI